MRLFFKGVRTDERTKKYIQKRLEAFEKIIDKPFNVEIEIDLDKKGKFRVEVMIKTPYDLFRAEETTESIEGSIDLVSSQIKIQIKKDKDKRETLVKRGGRSIKKKITLDKNARF
jgi:ribosomal subunit interface protein